MLASFALGCSEASKGTDANSSTGSSPKPGGNANANAGARATSSQSATIDIKEPERYSVAMTISIQETASEAPAPMLTQQLSFARLGADRRWAFVFPLGQIVYLEKSGLKYLVLFERKQYCELTAGAIGFQLGNVFAPNATAERLSPRQYEMLGLEPVNGRTATKYRLAAPSDASTNIDGVIFVDQETGLPLRSELNAAAPSGTKSRVIVEARDVQLNPDRAQFDVPSGMKKVTQQEAKQQIEGFASALRSFADIISGTQSAPVAKANQSAANKNASRSGR